MDDYRTFSQGQVLDVLLAHVNDLDDEKTTATLSKQDLEKDFESGQAALTVDENCIAIVRPENWKPGRPNSVLWLLFVRKDKRGTGIGQRFVFDVLERYAQTVPMVLVCNGEGRVAFFKTCGFNVVKLDSDGSAIMQSNEKHPHSGRSTRG